MPQRLFICETPNILCGLWSSNQLSISVGVNCTFLRGTVVYLIFWQKPCINHIHNLCCKKCIHVVFKPSIAYCGNICTTELFHCLCRLFFFFFFSFYRGDICYSSHWRFALFTMSCKAAALIRLLFWKKQPEQWCFVAGSAAPSGAEGAGDADWGWWREGVLCGWFQSSSDQFQLCSSITAIYFVLLFIHIRSAAETHRSEHGGVRPTYLCFLLAVLSAGGDEWHQVPAQTKTD